MRADDPAVSATPIELPLSAPPILFVVVDTEEEFDWSAPFSRQSTGVTALRHIGRAQQLFDRFGIVPTYVIDYPVASKPEGSAPLAEFATAGRATIGAHLHPWVTPPHDEDVTRANSFAMNLPAALEAAKLATMVEAIDRGFGARPQVYKAGRYGIAARTLDTLHTLGFTVDTSVNPHMDYTSENGPDFREFDARPCWLRHELLEIPCTTGYAGAAGQGLGSRLHATALALPSQLRAVGILARLGVTNRIMLSPEGSTLDEMKAITRALIARGLRTFTFSFHSPSVEPGHTPYVRSQADLGRFLQAMEQYFEFFFGELAGRATTPLAFRAGWLPQRSVTE
jgi:hypothetical protein